MCIVLLIAYRAYRHLTGLRITLPIAVLFHGFILLVSWADSFPTISFVSVAFNSLLGIIAIPIYKSDAKDRFDF